MRRCGFSKIEVTMVILTQLGLLKNGKQPVTGARTGTVGSCDLVEKQGHIGLEVQRVLRVSR